MAARGVASRMLGMGVMKNSITLDLPFPSPRACILEAEPLPAFRQSSVASDHRDLDVMARALAIDFPLHSPTELRRALLQAFGDLWPREDSIALLDHARDRLQVGAFA